MVLFRIARACETCEWVSEILSKLFPNRLFEGRPSHLTFCMKSKLATSKQYILNRYHNRFFRNHKKQDIFRKVVRECTRVGAKNYLSNSRGARLRRLMTIILHKQTNGYRYQALKCVLQRRTKLSDDFQFESDKISDNVQCL